MEHLYRAATIAPEPAVALSPLLLNLDVRQRGLDPFFRGVAVGALAALLGVVLGWFLLPI